MTQNNKAKKEEPKQEESKLEEPKPKKLLMNSSRKLLPPIKQMMKELSAPPSFVGKNLDDLQKPVLDIKKPKKKEKRRAKQEPSSPNGVDENGNLVGKLNRHLDFSGDDAESSPNGMGWNSGHKLVGFLHGNLGF